MAKKKTIDLAAEQVPSPQEAALVAELKAAGLMADETEVELQKRVAAVEAEAASGSPADTPVEAAAPPPPARADKPKIPASIKEKYASAVRLQDLEGMIVTDGTGLYWLQTVTRGLYELRPYWLPPVELQEQARKLVK